MRGNGAVRTREARKHSAGTICTASQYGLVTSNYGTARYIWGLFVGNPGFEDNSKEKMELGEHF